MKIAEFSWEFLPDLTRLVNSHISSVPPGWILSEAQVARILGSESAWSAHYPEDKRTFLSRIVCALDSGRLVAAAKWNWPNPEDPEWRWGEDYLHIGWPSEQRDVALLAGVDPCCSRFRSCCTATAQVRYRTVQSSRMPQSHHLGAIRVWRRMVRRSSELDARYGGPATHRVCS